MSSRGPTPLSPLTVQALRCIWVWGLGGSCAVLVLAFLLLARIGAALFVVMGGG